MDIEAIVEQRIADALATPASNHHTKSGVGAGREISQVNHQGSQRTCPYEDFANFKPKKFYGNKGTVGLTRWIEKTESVFEISSCVEESKVKFVACTFRNATMSWWNGHIKTMGLENANALN